MQGTVNVLKFCLLKFMTNRIMQMVTLQTQIRWPIWSGPTVFHSTKYMYFKKQLHKKQNFSQKSMESVFKILGHLQ